MQAGNLVVGILAHVDAGKTTLSEGLLYTAGALRRLGRVDHRDAFLDTDAQERERGITIFAKQAELRWQGLALTLLDTPGHVDFSSEAERTLQVLDCAILVISGADGVQAHTRTLWRLLGRHRLPTFLFINKMDQPGTDKQALLSQLQAKLGEGCVDFSAPDFMEHAALCHEGALSRYLEAGALTDGELSGLVAQRCLFPCYFGSALKLSGVEALLEGMARFAPRQAYPPAFAARVYKIGRDAQGQRLTYLKLTGGSLRVKDSLTGREAPAWEEKVNQIRIYSGGKYRTAERVEAGAVCAVTGLTHTRCGEGLGAEPPGGAPQLAPVFTYRVLPAPGQDPHRLLASLRQLEEEEPELHVAFSEALGEIHVQLMGEVQAQILKRQLMDRFSLPVALGEGRILYRETLAAPARGIGHYEPLRHYAEVHLLLEPGERGSGLRFATVCPEDELEGSWQRLILTHLKEIQHPGVLTGSPITDMKITLTAGRAHLKHTEGGDFRQATYRAVRQGLMSGQSILLEPWYDLRLELPQAYVGRAMTDLAEMGGTCAPPESLGEEALLAATAPVSRARYYAREVAAYTRGRGRIAFALAGYAPCQEQEKLVAAWGYDPQRDTAHPADSVFCAHGAGFVVKWNEVPRYAHLKACSPAPREEAPPKPAPSRYTGTLAEDEELMAIFERTYGPVKPRAFAPVPSSAPAAAPAALEPPGPEYLLVDGYNIIFAWDDLKAVARQDLEGARQLLMDMLCNYQGFRQCQVILVFDAYKVPHSAGAAENYHNIHVVYTKSAETADNYIEKATLALSRNRRVAVATSDGLEQLIILGHGALRLSAAAFRAEMEAVNGQIAALLGANSPKERSQLMAQALHRAWDKKRGPRSPEAAERQTFHPRDSL